MSGKMKNYTWTTPAGDKYEVRDENGYFHLYVNSNHTQQALPNTTHREEAISRLVNSYNEANGAEVSFFKNHHELNP